MPTIPTVSHRVACDAAQHFWTVLNMTRRSGPTCVAATGELTKLAAGRCAISTFGEYPVFIYDCSFI